MQQPNYDLIVVGAGPAGLACGIAAKEAGLSCLIIDKGSVVDAIRRFPLNMTFFSTAEQLEIGNLPFLSSGFRPTRVETVKYYLSTARYYQLPIRTGERVLSVVQSSEGFLVTTGAGTYPSANVVIAVGYFDNPVPYDVPGADLPKVHRCYTEPFEYVGKKVAVVGGRNSAVELALELFRNGAEVTLIHRQAELSSGVKYWMLPDIQNRIKFGEIQAYFNARVKEIRPESIVINNGTDHLVANDVLFSMIGYLPDNSLLSRAGVKTDQDSLIPTHDPATMETNIPGLFIAGSIAAGRFNNKIFIENGRLHGKAIAACLQSRRDSHSTVH